MAEQQAGAQLEECAQDQRREGDPGGWGASRCRVPRGSADMTTELSGCHADRLGRPGQSRKPVQTGGSCLLFSLDNSPERWILQRRRAPRQGHLARLIPRCLVWCLYPPSEKRVV